MFSENASIIFINQIFFFPALEHGNHGRSKAALRLPDRTADSAALNAARAGLSPS